MKLFEYQGESFFREYGIPTAGGIVCWNPKEAKEACVKLGGKAVVKAQVLSGGRGKAGGVKVVSSPEEAENEAERILNLEIKGHKVKCLFLVPQVQIQKEYYLSMTINRSEKRLELIISSSGGVDIEEVAISHPELIDHYPIFPDQGPGQDDLNLILKKHFPKDELQETASSIVSSMYRLFTETDASLVEINPLVVTIDQKLLAIDAKILFDDNALYKHKDLETFRNSEEYDLDEIEAKKAGLSFVSLDGNIGCMVNGAGLSMATMDLIKHFGQSPANFLDIGGSSNPEKVVTGLSILLRNPKVRAILLNIFGGITRCDDIAKGLVEARNRIDVNVPIVIRLIGTNDVLGREILQQEGLQTYESLTDAVKAVVKLV